MSESTPVAMTGNPDDPEPRSPSNDGAPMDGPPMDALREPLVQRPLKVAETDLAEPAARRLTWMALTFWSTALAAHLTLGRAPVAATCMLPIGGLLLARFLLSRNAGREGLLVLALASNVTGFFAVSALTGGVMAPTLLFLPTFAVAAGLLSPRARALLWGLAAVVLIASLGLLEYLELLPEQFAAARFEMPVNVVCATLGALFIGLRSHRVMTSLADENGRRALAAEEMARSIQQANARSEELLKRRSAFLANVSHELRTPLGAIVGLTTALGEGAESSEQRDILQTLGASTESLRKLVDDLLDHEAMDRGFVRIEKSVVDVRRLVRDISSLFAATASRKGLRLTHEIGPNLPRRVEGDPLRLRQVLSNLLSNALKYTTAGEVVVRANYQESEQRYVLEVSDTGPGIDDAAQAVLFMPFERTDSATARRTTGTGLGLALSKGLAEAMGGQLELTSEIGVGSTFRVVLPCVSVAESDPPPTPPSVDVAARKPRTIVDVLVVDDDATNRTVASLLIQRLGHRVQTAADGAAALDAARTSHFDVILLDYHMPDMLGTELAVQIRAAIDPVPLLVALTAAAFGDTRRACEAAGIPYFLSKPIDMDSLRELLDQAGRIRRGSKSLRAVRSSPEPLTAPSIPAALTPRSERARVLDEAHLAEVIGLFGPPEEQRRYLDEFLADADAMVKKIRAGHLGGDLPLCFGESHRLSGAASTIGAVHLAEAARAAERAAKAGALPEPLVANLERALRSTRRALQTEVR